MANNERDTHNDYIVNVSSPEYTRVYWKNDFIGETPLDEVNLNRMDSGIQKLVEWATGTGAGGNGVNQTLKDIAENTNNIQTQVDTLTLDDIKLGETTEKIVFSANEIWMEDTTADGKGLGTTTENGEDTTPVDIVNIPSRFVQQYGTFEEWSSYSDKWVPLKGEIVVYAATPLKEWNEKEGAYVAVSSSVKLKVGDGVNPLEKLPFLHVVPNFVVEDDGVITVNSSYSAAVNVTNTIDEVKLKFQIPRGKPARFTVDETVDIGTPEVGISETQVSDDDSFDYKLKFTIPVPEIIDGMWTINSQTGPISLKYPARGRDGYSTYVSKDPFQSEDELGTTTFRFKIGDVDIIQPSTSNNDDRKLQLGDLIIASTTEGVWLYIVERFESDDTTIITRRTNRLDHILTETEIIDIADKVTGSIQQDDWSVNDSAHPAHILNRTHWIDNDGTIHKLDNKYIDAEWMAVHEQHLGAVVFPETTVTKSSDMFINVGAELDLGLEYVVIINEEEVLVKSTEYAGGEGIELRGTSPSGITFAVQQDYFSPTMKVISHNSDSPITIEICSKGELAPVPLPKEFLPKLTATDVSGVIKTPQGEDVQPGQILVVKTVENGVPIEWETVNFNFDVNLEWNTY